MYEQKEFLYIQRHHILEVMEFPLFEFFQAKILLRVFSISSKLRKQQYFRILKGENKNHFKIFYQKDENNLQDMHKILLMLIECLEHSFLKNREKVLIPENDRIVYFLPKVLHNAKILQPPQVPKIYFAPKDFDQSGTVESDATKSKLCVHFHNIHTRIKYGQETIHAYNIFQRKKFKINRLFLKNIKALDESLDPLDLGYPSKYKINSLQEYLKKISIYALPKNVIKFINKV